MTAIKRIASLKLTLVGLCLLGIGVLYAHDRPDASALWIAGPLATLCVNLLAAVWSNGRFRRQPALLAFHVCLLLMLVIATVGRLGRLEARVEIAEGQDFDAAQVQTISSGPWYRSDLETVAFRQGRIAVDYAPRVYRDGTRSTVWLADVAGRRYRSVIGDDQPLVVDGYRFYTTSNKGWAVQLAWRGAEGGNDRGLVHLPSYPLLVRKQLNKWTLPSGELAEVRLELEEVRQNDAWRLQSEGVEAAIAVRIGDREERLERGDTMAVSGGQLRYEGLKLWMGYRISRDPLVPWVAAAAVAAVASMAWHFWLVSWSVPLRGSRSSTSDSARA